MHLGSLILVAMLLFCCSTSDAYKDEHIYVSPSDNHERNDGSQFLCGISMDKPCHGFRELLNRTGQLETVSGIQILDLSALQKSTEIGHHYVHYMPGIYNTTPVFMYGFSNWSFVGIGHVTVRVGSFYGDYRPLWPYMSEIELESSNARRYPAAFYFRNSSNIEIINIEFSVDHNVALLAALTVDLSGVVDIKNCSFPEVYFDSSAVVIVYPIGPVNIIDGRVEALHGVRGYRELFLVVFGNIKGTLPNFGQVTIERTLITDVVAVDYRPVYLEQLFQGTVAYPEYDYRSNWKAATAVLVLFRPSSSTHLFRMRNCVIKGVRSNDNHSPVTIQFQGAYLNFVQMTDCTFADNTGSVGGAVALFFDEVIGLPELTANQVMFKRCNFTNNSALFNGGAVSVDYLADGEENRVIFEDCRFERNKAAFGGALILRYNPYNNVDGSRSQNPQQAAITNCEFKSNTAIHGIIFADGVKISLYAKNVFRENDESCIVLMSSTLQLEGYPYFIGNHALDGAVISVNTGSQVYMNSVREAHFIDNFADRHGGVMWADDDSTAVTYNQFLLHSTDFIDPSRQCFVIFGNEGLANVDGSTDGGTRIFFSGNRAGVSGDVFYAYSFRHCWLGNFVPQPSVPIGRNGLSGLVTSFLNVRRAQPPSNITTSSSAPSFFALRGASCRCFKPVGSVYISITYCTETEALNVFSNVSALKTSAELLSEEFYGFGGRGGYTSPSAGIGVTPTSDLLYFPWLFTVYDDTKKAGPDRQATLQPNPSLITLTPAPGEVFDLNFTLIGQFLEPSEVTAYLQVETSNYDLGVGVLLEYNGFVYPNDSRVYFSPNNPLNGLRLHGLEGASGVLVAQTSSHVLGLQLWVRIPFVLARCPLGFFSPQAAFLPKDELRNVMSLTEPLAVDTDHELTRFACNCYSIDEPYNKVVSYCDGGLTAYIFKSKWLGDPYAQESSNKSISCGLIDFHPASSEVTCHNKEPSVVVGTKPDTGYADCILDFCKDTTLDTWTSAQGPCKEHRRGPLCGQCEQGYAVTPSSLECVQCSSDNKGVVIFLSLFLGLVVVLATVLLNIRITPTFASLLFFTQMAALFMDVNNPTLFIIHLVNLDFTFGLCFSSDLTAIERLSMHFFPPIYMLVLVISFTLLARRVRRLSRYVSRRSCLHGVLLIILLSYFSLANVVFSFMRCVELNPSDKISPSHRFLDDPSLACYENPHLTLFIISCLLAGLIIVPFPLAILLLRRSTRFRPFGDVCYSLYKDSRWWWCALDLTRRLLFALINTFVQSQTDSTLKSTLLTASAVFVLLIHGIGSPYQSQFDNVLESLFLFDLCCLSLIYSGWGARGSSWFVADLVYIPWLFAALMWLYHARWKLLKLLQKCGFCADYHLKQRASGSTDSADMLEDREETDDRDSIEMLVKRRGSTIVLPGLRDRLLDEEMQDSK